MVRTSFAVLLFLAGCGAAGSEGEAAGAPLSTGPAGAGAEAPADDRDPDELVAQGIRYLEGGRCDLAIAEALDPALAIYAARIAPGATVVAMRGGGESVLRALLEAQLGDRAAHLVIVGAEVTDAMYYRAFCLVELGALEEAARQLEAALSLMPDDVVYACELAHIRQAARRWDDAMSLYQAALDNVDALEARGAIDPAQGLFGHSGDDWRRRALRGLGFTLIELGRFDEAEAMYHRVLALDPNDERALHELQIIEDRRRRTL